jgi:hypothetical protein
MTRRFGGLVDPAVAAAGTAHKSCAVLADTSIGAVPLQAAK